MAGCFESTELTGHDKNREKSDKNRKKYVCNAAQGFAMGLFMVKLAHVNSC